MAVVVSDEIRRSADFWKVALFKGCHGDLLLIHEENHQPLVTRLVTIALVTALAPRFVAAGTASGRRDALARGAFCCRCGPLLAGRQSRSVGSLALARARHGDRRLEDEPSPC